MKTIGDILSRDLTKKIVEVIQVDADKDEDLYSEITEYIATDSIKEQYAMLLKAIAEAPADPHDSVGVWISGFFGSGKSSFAKNLGYALQNRKVMDQDFSTLFKEAIDDEKVTNLLDSINARIPTKVVLFEVAKERDTRKAQAAAVSATAGGRARGPGAGSLLSGAGGRLGQFGSGQREFQAAGGGQLEKLDRLIAVEEENTRLLRRLANSPTIAFT